MVSQKHPQNLRQTDDLLLPPRRMEEPISESRRETSYLEKKQEETKPNQ